MHISKLTPIWLTSKALMALPLTFLVHLMAGLIAYCHQPKKPSLGLDAHLLLAV